MPLQLAGVIEIPSAVDSAFDHGAFEPATGRVFVAHTARNALEVIDSQTRRHVASREGFSEAAGVVADAGQVLVTNRGSAELVWLDATTLKENARFETAPRPNGVAIVARSRLAVAACVGDDGCGPELQVIDLAAHRRWAIPLPGRPRWCVPDAAGERIFLAIRDPSMVLVARLPDPAMCSIGRSRHQVRTGSTSITELGASTPPVTAARSSRLALRQASSAPSGRLPAPRMRPSPIRRAVSCMSRSRNRAKSRPSIRGQAPTPASHGRPARPPPPWCRRTISMFFLPITGASSTSLKCPGRRIREFIGRSKIRARIDHEPE
jgi:hypothetical protein